MWCNVLCCDVVCCAVLWRDVMWCVVAWCNVVWCVVWCPRCGVTHILKHTVSHTLSLTQIYRDGFREMLQCEGVRACLPSLKDGDVIGGEVWCVRGVSVCVYVVGGASV